jgi:NADH-quinone oxidoreductase subunit L
MVTTDGAPLETHFDLMFTLVPVVLVLLAIFSAARMYKTDNDSSDRVAASFGNFYKAASKKFYVDEIYLFITRKVIFHLIGRPAAWIDRNIIDAFVNGVANATASVSAFIKGLQSGKVQTYALYFFSGIAGLAILFIYLWK